MSSATKLNPFKVAKTKTTGSKLPVYTPEGKVHEAIDEYKAINTKIKHLEGEASVYKEMISSWCSNKLSEKILLGTPENFKIQGPEQEITYVVQDKSNLLTEEDRAELVEKFGDEAAEALIEDDYSTVRFNEDVLKENMTEVLKALQTLPSDVYDNLFKPMGLKAKKGAIKEVSKFCKTKEDVNSMMSLLKLRSYIK